MSAIRAAFLMMSVMLSFLMAVPASAGLVTDTWDPTDVLLDLDNDDNPIPGVSTSYQYQHDISDDGFAVGDTITSATLYVTVRDAGGAETYEYEIGLGPYQTSIFSNVPNSREDQIVLGVDSLADLQTDGIIGVLIQITADSNNQEGLFFVSSRLVAQVDVGEAVPAQVPEPSVLALMAFGLLMGGGLRRRFPYQKRGS